MSEITIPKINSRQKGLQIQFYTTMPAKYSETGKRRQITGAFEDEVKKKFRKEAKRTMRQVRWIWKSIPLRKRAYWIKHSGSPQNRGFRSPEGFLRGGYILRGRISISFIFW